MTPTADDRAMRARLEAAQAELKSLRAFDFETELARAQAALRDATLERAQLRSQVKIKRARPSPVRRAAPRSVASRVASFCAVALQVIALAAWGTSEHVPALAGFGSVVAFFALIAAAIGLGWSR